MPGHDYETLVQIKLAAQILKEGFWMGDLVDFLNGYGIKVVGNPTNTSKWTLAKASLEAIKDTKKLQTVFKAIINNKIWYYPEPKKALKTLSESTKIKTNNILRQGKFVLSLSTLHPVVRKVCKDLFEDGHYSQAIFEAYKAVVNEVKKISGVRNLDGKPLMERVFSVNNPIIKFNKLQSQTDRDEQVGLILLFSGAALGIRNPKAHDNIIQKDSLRTLEYLSFASLLLKKLDERIV